MTQRRAAMTQRRAFRRLRWPLLVAALTAAVAASAQAPPPAEHASAAPWHAELLAVGQGWWCTKARLLCVRDAVECQRAAGGTPCKRQRWAWAFSSFAGGRDDLRSGEVLVFRTREDCEATRQSALADAGSTVRGVSPCTRVGDRARLPLDGLPPGRGWWCFRFVHPAGGPDGSRCARTSAGCEDEVVRLNRDMVRPTPGSLTLRRPCHRVRRAWALKQSSPSDPTPVFEVFDNDDECRLSASGDPCRAVR